MSPARRTILGYVTGFAARTTFAARDNAVLLEPTTVATACAIAVARVPLSSA
jgi:hypothetical protein